VTVGAGARQHQIRQPQPAKVLGLLPRRGRGPLRLSEVLRRSRALQNPLKITPRQPVGDRFGRAPKFIQQAGLDNAGRG